jgi:hypothetical protein
MTTTANLYLLQHTFTLFVAVTQQIKICREIKEANTPQQKRYFNARTFAKVFH